MAWLEDRAPTLSLTKLVWPEGVLLTLPLPPLTQVTWLEDLVHDGAEEMRHFWLELGHIERQSYTAHQLAHPSRSGSPPCQPCLGSFGMTRSSSRQGSAGSTLESSPELLAERGGKDISPWNSPASLRGLSHTSLISRSTSPLLSPRLESQNLDELYESIQTFKLQSLHHLACAKQRVEQSRSSVDEVQRGCSPEGDHAALPELDLAELHK